MISRNKQRKELIRMLYAMLDELEAKERHPNPGFPFNLVVDPIRWVGLIAQRPVGTSHRPFLCFANSNIRLSILILIAQQFWATVQRGLHQ